MSEFDNDGLPVQDEMTALKARADMLGLNYHPSIGLDKLREKVTAAVTAEGPLADTAVTAPFAPVIVETEGQIRGRMKREANELVRIRVTCMNPAKAEWEGEMFTCGNSVVGSFTKFVPFNNDEGWHVPRIIFHMMRDRQCQIFTSVKDERGNTVRKGKLIKEFGIEVMDALTPEELDEMARRQAASQAIA